MPIRVDLLQKGAWTRQDSPRQIGNPCGVEVE